MQKSNAVRLLIFFWLSAAMYLFGYTFYAYNINSIDLESALQNDRGYFFEPCKCLKHTNRTGRTTKISTCSEEASWYGPHQKVISYSLYHSKYSEKKFSDFAEGIDLNLNQIKKYYPEWVVRIYTNETLDGNYCKFACLDQVFWCDIRNSSVPHMNVTNGLVWRFLPLGDETVDIFGSRDIDSYVLEREQEVMNEWEFLSNKPFHLARDSFGRGRPMLAGFWNAKNYLVGTEKARESWPRFYCVQEMIMVALWMRSHYGKSYTTIMSTNFWNMTPIPAKGGREVSRFQNEGPKARLDSLKQYH